VSSARRHRPGSPGGRTGSASKAWFQLVVLFVLLLGVLLFMTQLGETSAGCFHQIAGVPDAEAPSAVHDAAHDAAAPVQPTPTPP
jgi:hypothetical protein